MRCPMNRHERSALIVWTVALLLMTVASWIRG